MALTRTRLIYIAAVLVSGIVIGLFLLHAHLTQRSEPRP